MTKPKPGAMDKKDFGGQMNDPETWEEHCGFQAENASDILNRRIARERNAYRKELERLQDVVSDADYDAIQKLLEDK